MEVADRQTTATECLTVAIRRDSLIGAVEFCDFHQAAGRAGGPLLAKPQTRVNEIDDMRQRTVITK